MDRNEAVLRELNLYPLWVRRNAPAPIATTAIAGAGLESPTQSGTQANAGVIIHESPEKKGAVATEGAVNNTASHGGTIHETPLGDMGWTELKQRVRGCSACKLRAGCTQTVFGVGDESADWLFVGEGPGADEDAKGEPFVGQAGKLLDNMLLSIRLRRGVNAYIANVVKCRPPGNRNPEADEIAACLPYLKRQIELIKPRLIVALGKVASNALLANDAPLGSLRGKLHECGGIPLIVTYHPAYLLRTPSEKAKAWQDLCLAREVMQKR